MLLREVDDAVRQDELLSFWQQWGKLLMVTIGAGLLALAGWLFWNNAKQNASAEQGEKMTMALDQYRAGNLEAADEQAALLGKDAGPGYKAAANLLRADIALKMNKQAEAANLLAAIAADSAAPQPYRDLAAIREITIRFDTMKPEDVISRLKPLATPGAPWFGSAAELVGLAYLKQGKPELAGPILAEIAKDEKAPPTLRRRARQLSGSLGVDSIVDVDKVVSGADMNPGAAAAPATGPASAAPAN